MVQKLTDDEKTFLLSKYLSKGLSEKEAERKVNRTINLMVVSALTMII